MNSPSSDHFPATEVTGLVFSSDEARLVAPESTEPGDSWRICAVGAGWLELCDDLTAVGRDELVRIGTRRRFEIPLNDYGARARFGRPPRRLMLSLLARRGPRRWMLVANLDYAHAVLRAEDVQPEWLLADCTEPSPWRSGAMRALPDSRLWSVLDA